MIYDAGRDLQQLNRFERNDPRFKEKLDIFL